MTVLLFSNYELFSFKYYFRYENSIFLIILIICNFLPINFLDQNIFYLGFGILVVDRIQQKCNLTQTYTWLNLKV